MSTTYLPSCTVNPYWLTECTDDQMNVWQLWCANNGGYWWRREDAFSHRADWFGPFIETLEIDGPSQESAMTDMDNAFDWLDEHLAR